MFSLKKIALFFLIAINSINVRLSKGDRSLLNNSLYRLQSKLLEGYNGFIRPVSNPNKTTMVNIDLNLLQVVSMDDRAETVTISGWLILRWTDEGIKWNPNDYEGIQIIRLPVEIVWNPDIFLNNAASEKSWNPWSVTNILVDYYPNGSAYCTPPSLITTNCRLNIEDFPFDNKDCEFQFGSWMYTIEFINLTTGPNVLLDPNIQYFENGEWNLESTSQKAVRVTYEGDGTYSMVHVNLFFRRRTLFYSFNLITPGIMISILSILVFILPPGSGEKIGLQITTLLAVIFFVQFVSTIVPPSSLGIAKISLYLLSVAILGLISLVGNIITVYLDGRDSRIQKEMPQWFESLVCHRLGRLFRIGRNKIEPFDETMIELSQISFNPKSEIDEKLIRYLMDMNQVVSFTYKHFYRKRVEELKDLKWKFAAIVMDRLFLIITSVYFIITFGSLVLSNKNFYKPT